MLKKVSKKQVVSNRKVSEAKNNKRMKMLEEYGYIFCESCGTNEPPIDCSHVIPIGKRKDLEAEERIIFMQCRTCHRKTEHGYLSDLKNKQEILEVIKEFDESYYQRVLLKLIP